VDIYEEIVKLRSEGKDSSLATIVQCNGSTPQKTGAKMLVREDGSIIGTVGGGSLEAEVIKSALMVLKEGVPRTISFELTEDQGELLCGGKVLVYIEPLVAAPHLIILGAGHVGKALARTGKFLGFKVTVVDDREEYANKNNIPDADKIVVTDFRNVFSRVGVEAGSYLVIATRGHNHDFDALKAALRTKAGYIGLLGSKRKRNLLLQTLEKEGFSHEDIGRVIIPVGIPIGSVTPEEIAISVMAQIIQTRNMK
jgi:xanthine dehydrogenase accessory factor